MSACDGYCAPHDPVTRVMAEELLPTLQRMSDRQITVKHFTLLRQDNRRLHRVARAILSGGWPMSKAEEGAYDHLGESRMQIAAQIKEIWGITEDSEKDNPRIQYSVETIRNKVGPLVHLVYITGATPLEQYYKALELPMFDQERMREEIRPHFLKWEQNYQKIEPGYYLIKLLRRELVISPAT